VKGKEEFVSSKSVNVKGEDTLSKKNTLKRSKITIREGME